MKTKLTPQLQEKIIKYIKAGNYIKIACKAVGIDETTYYRWIEKGKKGEEPYCKFYKSIKKARAEAEVYMVSRVVSVAKENWQAAMTWLERSFPERWAKREYVGGTGDRPIEIVMKHVGTRFKKDKKRDKSN